MKIVINNCYGGFGISNLAIHELRRRKGLETYFYSSQFDNKFNEICKKVSLEYEGLFVYPTEVDYGDETSPDDIEIIGEDLSRDNPELIAIIEELGEKAYARYSKLKIIEIPDNVEWEIEDYDGMEWVAEKHRTWS